MTPAQRLPAAAAATVSSARRFEPVDGSIEAGGEPFVAVVGPLASASAE